MYMINDGRTIYLYNIMRIYACTGYPILYTYTYKYTLRRGYGVTALLLLKKPFINVFFVYI